MFDPTLPLAIRLFGPVEVRLHGEPLPRLRTRKGQWLLALLALRAGQEVERSWLAGTLWPDSDEPQAFASLRKSLADLRAALGEEARCVLSPGTHTLRLDPSGMAIDVAAFDADMVRGDAPSLEEAAALYRGPLLEGCGEEWAFQERAPREQAYLIALETLAGEASGRGDPAAAERYLRLAVGVDPLRESAQRARMTALAAGGNYAAALLAYRELRLLLHRELNAEPDPETTALFQRIRQETAQRSTESAPRGRGAGPDPDVPPPAAPLLSPASPLSASPAIAEVPSVPASGTLEIAHVLYIDLVGYTLLPMARQPLLLAEMQAIVRGTSAFRRAEAAGDLICIPSGDGLALVFFRDPAAPVECAVAIAREARGRPHLKLRAGVHTGPVYRVADINAAAGVAGGGINLAQRVMACADAGHILLSQAAREMLLQVGDWPIHDLGECEVKHGVRLRLFNLYTEDVGNPAVPSAFCRRPAPAAVAADRPRTARKAPSRAASGQVMLLYKRDADPDESVLRLLEHQLGSRGFDVFIDCHLEIGVEWAKEIERQIRASHAVVPLLSAASVSSEMLQYELQIAHEASLQQAGRPRILPVRLRFPDPLCEPLASLLEPIQYATWNGPEEDERVVEALVRALENPTRATAAVRERLEPVGGAVPLDSAFYVIRPVDEDFRTAMARRDSIVLVKGARQMGKTSLLARGLHQARKAGARVIRIDFQALNAVHLETLDALFLKLAGSIADQLDLETDPEEVWHPRRGPSENFKRYWQRVALRATEAPIVWGLDEVDRLFGYDFASEVFGLFRSWHNDRALDPEGPWHRLTLAIAYATEPYLFITDINQSPFNVGTRLTIEDFTVDYVADLNERYGSPLRSDAEIARYQELVEGQPYLVRQGLHQMVTQGVDLPALEAQADRDEGLFGDHLRRMLVLLARDPDLCDVVREVLRGGPCPTEESFYRLRSAGVLAGDSARLARPRCALYASYLSRHLL